MSPAEARRRIAEQRDLNAFISLTHEEGSGPVVAVKDLVDVRGTVTTAGSSFFAAAPPAVEDAPLVRRMREFGCVVIGKTNLHEWAYGISNDNPHHGPTRNPRDPGRVSGGSSGGSAVAVAAGLCDWAVGSDTGGSIRVPAAFCGVVGFKPTIGSVDTTGVVPLSPSLDTMGPLAPDVATAARALEMMSDLTGLLAAEPTPLSDLRLAVPDGWGRDLEPGQAEAWAEATVGLAHIPFPDGARLDAAGATILQVEAAALHRHRVEATPEGYGRDVLARLRRGLEIGRSAYVAALLEQSRLRVEAEAAMRGWDAILAPVSRIEAPRLGSEYSVADITAYTRPFNTTGQPVIALPDPRATTRLPFAVQVVGHFGREADLVAIARALEAVWLA